MGKRSNFERNPRDYYTTPQEAVFPLLAHLPRRAQFIEPCAGDGRLVRHLTKQGHSCVYACDIEPQPSDGVLIHRRDVLFFDNQFLPSTDYIITNPPWSREMLHPMIEKFRMHAQTWLLFDAGFMHNKESKPFLRYCRRIVSVGRVSWMGNGISSMDDCCWYEFIAKETTTQFIM
jgi:hypothetical protein